MRRPIVSRNAMETHLKDVQERFNLRCDNNPDYYYYVFMFLTHQEHKSLDDIGKEVAALVAECLKDIDDDGNHPVLINELLAINNEMIEWLEDLN